MADKIFHSAAVTFVDMTDSRILDVYISTNHPTVQLCNVNKTPLEYTPDWSKSESHLKLEAKFYLDSSEITPETIEWYIKIGENQTTLGHSSILTVSTNVLANDAIVTYGCKITYENLESFKEITFVRVDTGLDGTNGSSAPAVRAQYSADGEKAWSSTLNTATHKYVRYSYDGGITWTTGIKMVGEDGTSVVIMGVAYTPSYLAPGEIVTLYSDADQTIAINTNGFSTGYSYLVDGYLCVYSADSKSFICTGLIQGPPGLPGQSSYVYIRYATDANGTGMFEAPNSTTTYIGICVTDLTLAPNTPNLYTWSKFVGDSAKSIILNGSSQIFKVSSGITTQTCSPTVITINAQATNINVAKWEYSNDGGEHWTEVKPDCITFNSSTHLTIMGSELSSNSLVVRASNGAYSDTYTIYKVFDGMDGTDGAIGPKGDSASMAFLTNENVSFPSNAKGKTYGAYMTTSVVAYTGTKKVLPTIGTILTDSLPDGLSVYVDEELTARADNEIVLMIAVDSGKNLGSESSNSGEISIPIVSPIKTTLKLTWSKINTGMDSVTFQIYAPNGYLLTSDIPSLSLQTFAYEGTASITSGATYQWYNLVGETWTTINGATNSTLTVNRDDVLSACNYKCEMVYKNNTYVAVATVEDKTDTYSVLIRADARYSADNLLYWIMYATVYSDIGERDALLGPISNTAPTAYTIGTYWYQINDTDYTVTLKQYDGTQWVDADDQELRYNWFLLTDTENPMTLGNQSKVKIVTSNDFVHMCNIQCDVCDVGYELLTRNSQVLIDHTDPIVSTSTPTNPIDGQIWIKMNSDGTHNICVWDELGNRWAVSNTDSQNKLYVEKPVQYTIGDIWVVGADYQPNGFVVGSMLKAQYSSSTYSDDDWVAALSYQDILDELKSQMSVYKQVFSVDNNNLTMRAQNANGTMSDLRATLTNDNLTFNYGNHSGTSLNHKQITTPTINVTSDLNISGNTPILNLGAFSLKIEENGSLSIISNN